MYYLSYSPPLWYQEPTRLFGLRYLLCKQENGRAAKRTDHNASAPGIFANEVKPPQIVKLCINAGRAPHSWTAGIDQLTSTMYSADPTTQCDVSVFDQPHRDGGNLQGLQASQSASSLLEPLQVIRH